MKHQWQRSLSCGREGYECSLCFLWTANLSYADEDCFVEVAHKALLSKTKSNEEIRRELGMGLLGRYDKGEGER